MEEEVVRKFQDVFLPGASYKTTQTATFRGGSWCDVERFAPIEINGTRTGKLHQTLDDSFGEFGLEGSFSWLQPAWLCNVWGLCTSLGKYLIVVETYVHFAFASNKWDRASKKKGLVFAMQPRELEAEWWVIGEIPSPLML